MSADQSSLSAKKEALSRETEMYKHAIEEQVSVMKQNAGQVSKKLLVVGAGVAVAYFVGRAIIKRTGKKRKSTNLLLPAHNYTDSTKPTNALVAPAARYETSVASLIKQQIAIFLIGIATQKLQQLLEGSGKENREPIKKNDTTTYTDPIHIH